MPSYIVHRSCARIGKYLLLLTATIFPWHVGPESSLTFTILVMILMKSLLSEFLCFSFSGVSGTSACPRDTYSVASKALAETGVCSSSRALTHAEGGVTPGCTQLLAVELQSRGARGDLPTGRAPCYGAVRDTLMSC